MTHQQDVEPMAALVGTLVAISEAARHAGAGMRTAGRRVLANVVDSGQRATVAFRVYRGDRVVNERRPAEYVAAGVIAGMMAAFATAALGRALSRGPDGGPGASRASRRRLGAARSTAVRRRRAAPVPVPAEAARAA